MPRTNPVRRLSIALGLGKPIEKVEEKLAEVKEEKKEEKEEAKVAEENAAVEAPVKDPVVIGAVSEASTAPIPGTGALAQFLTLSKEKYLNDIKANPPRGGLWTVAMGNEAGGEFFFGVLVSSL
jgi:hypothetical protein